MASEDKIPPSPQTESSDGKEQGSGDTTKEVQEMKKTVEQKEEEKLKAKYPSLKMQEMKKTAEQKEEEKLKAKYPSLKVGPPAMLHKRLIQKGKFFDSGDYNMARAAINNPKRPLPAQEKMLLQESIGEGIPTPKDLPPRKPSIIQSKLASGALS